MRPIKRIVHGVGWYCIVILVLCSIVSPSRADDVSFVQASDEEFQARLGRFGLSGPGTYLMAQADPGQQAVQGGAAPPGGEPAFLQAAPVPPPSRTQFTGENRLLFYNNRVTGAQERSFLKRGTSFVEELDLGFTHQFENDMRFEAALGARLTDDETVDRERASLQRFYLKLSGITFEATVGDAMANFSQYTLTQNIRGLSAWKDFSILEGTRVSVVAGLIKARWEELWKDIQGETYTKYVEGVRLEQRITDKFSLSLNAVTLKDDTGSLPDSKPGETATAVSPIENHVGSLEFSFRPSRDFRLDGEAATSWLDANLKDSEAVKKSDQAYRLDTRFRVGSVRVGGGYNRIEPDYYSAGAMTTADLEEYYAKAEIDVAQPLLIGAAYRNSWDNVKNQKEFRTKAAKPEAFFLLTAIPGVSLEGRYKEIQTTASDGKEDKTTKTASGNLSWQLGPARLSLSYEDRKKEDAIDPTREGNGYLATSRLDLQLGGEKLSFTPHVGYDREQDKTATVKSTQQTTYGGLILEVPSMIALELAYRRWDTDTTELGLDTIRSEAKAEIRYSLFGNPSRTLALAYVERDYEFEKTGATSSMGYTEKRVEGRFNYRF